MRVNENVCSPLRKSCPSGVGSWWIISDIVCSLEMGLEKGRELRGEGRRDGIIYFTLGYSKS